MTSDMYSRVARLASFERGPRPAKKRTSSQNKKKAANAWPHDTPKPDELARAGFYFHPDDHEGDDNVKCFSCRANLNGWEPEDDPINEHVSHRPDCAWALAVSVVPRDGREPDERDPLSNELLQARLATFSHGPGWPHEQELEWNCTIQNMAEAGWAFEAGVGYEDGAACHYCGLELDGWEQEDDPYQEHKKRMPECRFFALVEKYHSVKKPTKAKAKTSKKARGSAASKASRSSVQSTVSTATTDVMTVDDSLDDELSAEAESQSKPAKPKKTVRVATKATKGRKRAQSKTTDATKDTELVAEPEAIEETKPTTKPKRATKKAARTTKQASLAPSQDMDEEKPTKAARTATGKKKASTKAASRQLQRQSDASIQLQDELEESIMLDDQITEESARKHSMSSRGSKRMSDGSVKSDESSASISEFPLPPSSLQKSKPEYSENYEVFSPSVIVDEPPPKRAKNTKSSQSKSSQTHQHAGQARSMPTTSKDDGAYDLNDEDERQIELQLAQIEAEQQMREVQAQSNIRKSNKQATSKDDFEILQDEVNEEGDRPLSSSAFVDDPGHKPLTPSPSSSDKENNASSLARSSIKSQHIYTSPTKTSRIPLAPSTPNRPSPAKRIATSPSKKLLGVTRSSVPWQPIDLENVLLTTFQDSPTKFQEQLATAAGSLSAEERSMTVEAWIKSRAGQADDELKRRCEIMVTAFERESNRALASLQGLHVME